MKKTIKCLIIISVLLLSIIFIPGNIISKANNRNNKLGLILNPKLNNYARSNNFDRGPIEVISEPIFGQNNNIDSSTQPSIAVEDDKIYVVWQDRTDYNNAGSDDDIFYRYFDGNNWSEIQVISEPINNQNNNIGDSLVPDIAVENSKIYVVWVDENDTNGAGTDWDIFYRCNLTGSNWEYIQVISEPVQGQNLNIGNNGPPSLVVENAKVYVVWNDDNNTNNASSDHDSTLSASVKTGSGNSPSDATGTVTLNDGEIYYDTLTIDLIATSLPTTWNVILDTWVVDKQSSDRLQITKNWEIMLQ